MPICSSCGAENPDGFLFCGRCAAPLAAREPAGRELRKTVTVVFCDVTGSTALGERLDPESLRRVMLRYFESMKQVIERHGGTVEKFMGDAVMAVFGVPLLHEDDALRAVRAAAEMREALAGLNEELAGSYGTTLEARIGVNTGEVVTGTEERLATGDAVNVAARLEQAAQPGEVLLGEETLRLTRAAVEVEPVESLSLKGKSGPVPAFRLVSVDPVGPARRLDAPLVGREAELERLRDAFAEAVRDSSCRLFTILGAAGVGKSRLVAGFLDSLDGATVVRGRCLPYGEGITYWPVVEVIKQLPDPRSLGLEDAVTETLRGLLGEQIGLTTSEEITWAFRKLLEAASRKRPLVCVIDDVQWGEETFLDLIEQFAYLSQSAPILLLCMARPDLLDRRPGWQAPLRLEPLDGEQSERLIEQRLGERRLEPALHERILAAAAGNPLFLEETAAMLIESGNGAVAVPPTIQALLAARLDQLDPAERAVLERGAVEGEIFHRGAVQALAPGEPQLTTRLTALVRKELIRPDRAQIAREDAFRFRHLLIRDAAYEALPKATRADLHERLAAWLQEHGRELAELDELLGHHLEQTYSYRTELGPLDEHARAIGTRAGERLASAGQRALDRRDMRAAVNLLGRAISLQPPDEPAVSLRLDLAEALQVSGQHALAKATATEAATLATAANDQLSALRSRLHAERITSITDPEGANAQLLALVEEARPLFELAGDELGMTDVWETIGDIESWRGQIGAALAAYEQAAAHARRAHNPRQEQRMLVFAIGAHLEGPTAVEQALSWLDTHAAAIEPRRPWLTGVRAELEAMLGHFDEARTLLRGAFERGAELGIHAALMTGSSWFVETLAGDHVAAEREGRRAYELLEQSGNIDVSSTSACLLAQSLCALGRYDEAEEWIARGEELSASDDILNQILVPQVRAKLLARKGEHSAAERLAREAVAVAEQTDWLNVHGDALVDLAEVLALTRRNAEAATTLERALQLYEQKGNLVSAAKARGLLAELREAVASEP